MGGFHGLAGKHLYSVGQSNRVWTFLCVHRARPIGRSQIPYFLVVAWLFHPVWGFIPRELPELYIDLPMACILFDIPIGIYLLSASRIKRWALLISA